MSAEVTRALSARALDGRVGRRRGCRGAAAVEFALVVPFLVLLTFALIQYGFYFWAMQGGSDLARNAVRLAAVGNPATYAAFREAVADDVEQFAGARGVPVIHRSYAKGLGNTAVGVEVGHVVTVTITFRSIDLGLPMLPFIDGGVVTETVEARVEYVPEQPESCP